MAVITIKNLADVDAVKFGDQLDMDGYVNWPEPPQTDEEIKSLDADMAEAQAREDKVLARVEIALTKQAEDIEAEKDKTNNGQGGDE